jgi:hypothetical protein
MIYKYFLTLTEEKGINLGRQYLTMEIVNSKARRMNEKRRESIILNFVLSDLSKQ